MRDDIVAIGDPHSIEALKDIVFKICNIVQNSIILCVGDCGFGINLDTEDKLVKSIEDKLTDSGCALLVCRGNHDNPVYFKDYSYINRQNASIYLVEDYGKIILNGKKFLFIGGAVSIDRVDRINAKTKTPVWWSDEILSYKDCSDEQKVDIVVSHSAPSFCAPLGFNSTVKHYIKLEKDLGLEYLEGQLLQERQSLTENYEELKKAGNKITHWFYGHFHQNYLTIVDDTKFICVANNDLYHVTN